jgi:acyl-coenzyme A synthetase/AMP-(fatty) acid ligase
MSQMTSALTATTTRSTIPLSDRKINPVEMVRSQFRSRLAPRTPMHVGTVAELAAEKFGRVPIYLDKPFAWDPAQRVELDYVELAEMVGQMSAVLTAAGLKRWDRVAIVKTGNYDVLPLAMAVGRCGGIPALLSPGLDPDIINILLKRLDPRFIITDQAVAEHAALNPDRLRALNATAIASIEGGIPVADLWGSPIPAPSPLRDDDPMMITHTSSTTGVSKLVEHSPRTASFGVWIETIVPFLHTSHDLFANSIAHVHARGVCAIMSSLCRGTSLLGIGSPDEDTIVSLFSRYRPTIVEAHPNDYMKWERFADDPSRPFASPRVYINNFDAIHPRTVRTLLGASTRALPLWIQSYGQSETLPMTVNVYTRRSIARAHDDGMRSVGWPCPRVRMRIADPETSKRRADQTKPGKIQARTPGRALGFVGTPDKFSERRHGKWFDTGDWGQKGRLGQLELLDRVADRIEGVESCLRIEDVLLDRFPDADEIVVVPGADSQPVPVVCLADGKQFDAELWRVAAAGVSRLGDPFVVSLADLPRTATLKSRRYLLSEMVKGDGVGDLGQVSRQVALREGA